MFRRTMVRMYRSARMICAGAALLLLNAEHGHSQQPDPSRLRGEAYFVAGLQAADVEALNERLAARGIRAFDEHFLTLGFAANLWLGRWLLGLEGHWLLERERTTAGFERTLSGDFALLDVGYALQLGNLQLYPIVGIGGGTMRLKSIERAGPSFDELLDEPRWSSELTQIYFLSHGGLRADYTIELSRKQSSTVGISIGAQAGYNVAIGHWEWELDGDEAFGGPAIGAEGGYVRVTIGFWAHRQRGSPEE